MKGLRSRSWDSFHVLHTDDVFPLIKEEHHLAQFKSAAEMVLQKARGVAAWRQLTLNVFTHFIPRSDSHSRRPCIQINVFAQQAPQIVDFMAKDGAIDKISLPRLYRASILFDSSQRIIEVVAQGGRPVRDGLVEAFREHPTAGRRHDGASCSARY